MSRSTDTTTLTYGSSSDWASRVPVEASSGSMGGSTSVEFMCPADIGEDLVVHCPSCEYAANIEKAASRLAEAADEPARTFPNGSTPRAYARSRTWPYGTTRPATGRSRHWSTSWTTRSLCSCCAVITR